MDNIETFRERLLQDEALQRSLHHQRDVVADAFAFMTTLRSLMQTERRKERRKNRKKDSYELRHTVPPYNGLSLRLSLSSSASQSFNFHFLQESWKMAFSWAFMSRSWCECPSKPISPSTCSSLHRGLDPPPP